METIENVKPKTIQEALSGLNKEDITLVFTAMQNYWDGNADRPIIDNTNNENLKELENAIKREYPNNNSSLDKNWKLVRYCMEEIHNRYQKSV